LVLLPSPSPFLAALYALEQILRASGLVKVQAVCSAKE
jgi:hypothetical protein